MDDDVLAQFTGITSASTERAQQYLQITDNNLEQALTLYFESDGADLGATTASASQPQRQHEVVNLDSDDDEGGGVSTQQQRVAVEDDEAMARRMQQEMYRGGINGDDIPGEEVRAPMARTTETLLGPNADWRDDPDDMHAAVLEQMRARHQRPSK